MKGFKLILEIVLLLLVLVGAAFLIESKYSKFETSADQIFKNYELYKDDSIVVVLGSSHTLMFDDYYPDTSKYVVNFSIGGQDLFREDMVLRKIVKDGAKIQQVILGLDFDALGYNQVLSGEGYIDKQYYKYLDTLYDDGFTNRLMGSSAFFRSNRDISYLFKESEMSNPIKSRGGKSNSIPYIPLGNGTLNDEDCRGRAIEHSSIKFHPNLIEENLSYVNDIISLCAENKIKLIIVTTPKMDCYRENSVSANIDKAKYRLIEMLKKEESLHCYHNLYDDTSFDASDFIDYDHLNQKGVIKLYQKLNTIFANK
ncbi:MAG: hypothetical protein ACO3EE_01150 [Flavobacteriales bacterium]